LTKVTYDIESPENYSILHRVHFPIGSKSIHYKFRPQIRIPPGLLDHHSSESSRLDAVFYCADPVLYHKFGNMVSFLSGNLYTAYDQIVTFFIAFLAIFGPKTSKKPIKNRFGGRHCIAAQETRIIRKVFIFLFFHQKRSKSAIKIT